MLSKVLAIWEGEGYFGLAVIINFLANIEATVIEAVATVFFGDRVALIDRFVGW